MSSLNVTFTTSASFPSVQAMFSTAITYWVENYQNKTSVFAKALMLGAAVNQFQHGSAFVGALALTAAKGQGTQHPTISTSKVLIPASATTYGGEMIVTAKPSQNGDTEIEIKGHTQGLLGGTLKDNVNGLKDYLIQALPEFEIQFKQITLTQNVEKSQANVSIAEEIERLAKLHKDGVISDDEYSQAKRKALGTN